MIHLYFNDFPAHLHSLDHHQLLHQRLDLPNQIHGRLQHNEGMNWWEGGTHWKLTLHREHAGNTVEKIRSYPKTFLLFFALNTFEWLRKLHLFTKNKLSSREVLNVWFGTFPRPSVTLSIACSTLLQEPSKEEFHTKPIIFVWITLIFQNCLSIFCFQTLIFQSGNVNQSSVLGAVHQGLQPLLAGSENSLYVGCRTELSEVLTVPRTGLQQPDHHPQQSPTQPNAFLCFAMTAERVGLEFTGIRNNINNHSCRTNIG